MFQKPEVVRKNSDSFAHDLATEAENLSEMHTHYSFVNSQLSHKAVVVVIVYFTQSQSHR